ncbi:MAG: prepilin peptidase [Acidobacteria bacterium]|nr:prepilin peptidase [Acidobacteriota bacterium]
MTGGNLPIAIAAAMVVVVIAAAIADLATRRIPNWITLPGAVLGVTLHAYYGGAHGAMLSLAGAGMAFAFFLLLHLAGGMGAGDVKLAGAVGALVGPQAFVIVFIATGLLGGVAAIALALLRRRLWQTLAQTMVLLSNFGRLRWNAVRRSSSLNRPDALRLPYGAVIAGGALAFLAFYH